MTTRLCQSKQSFDGKFGGWTHVIVEDATDAPCLIVAVFVDEILVALLLESRI